MKVLVVTDRFFPEEFIINDLVQAWAQGGMDVEVLTQVPSYPIGKIPSGYKNTILSSSRWGTIKVIRFRTVTGYRESLFLKILNYANFALFASVAALWIGRKYDRIFVYQAGPLTQAIPAVIAGKLYRKDVTIWTQDVWPDSVYAYGFKRTRVLRFILDRLVSFIYKNCNRIFVSCDGFRDKISRYAPQRPIYHFPNWPVVTPCGNGEGDRKILLDKFNFTFAGNVGKMQNLDNVIRGFGMASAENDNIQLNIVGDGSHLDHLKALVEQEQIKNVVFWGRKKQTEMPAFFNASDVMVISLNDDPVFAITVPVKFQAYLAFRKPIYCVMNGEVRKIVERSNVGLCANPNELSDIKSGFLKFYAFGREGLRPFAAGANDLLNSIYNRETIIESMRALVLEGR